MATVGIALVARSTEQLLGAEAASLVRGLTALAYMVGPPIASASVFMLLYVRVAPAGVTWQQAFGGVTVATAGFEGLKFGFVQYVAAFGDFDATYGALGFIVILLLFFSLSSRLMLYGAEVVRADRDFRAEPSLRELTALQGAAWRLVERLRRSR